MSTYAKVVTGIVCLSLFIAFMVHMHQNLRDSRERREWNACRDALDGWEKTTRGTETAGLLPGDYTSDWLSAHRLTRLRLENDWAKSHRFVDDSIVKVSRAGAYSRLIYDDCAEKYQQRARLKLGIPKRVPSDAAYTCYSLMDFWDKDLNILLDGYRTQFVGEFARGIGNNIFDKSRFPAMEEIFDETKFIDTSALFAHCLPVIEDSPIMKEKYD